MNHFALNRMVAGSFVLLTVAVAIGMQSATAAEADDQERGSEYLLKEQPKNAVDVLALKKEAKDQQDVVVVGRIGGRANPWIKGAAAFSIVDRSLRPCNEIEGDTCKTPWDYCCEADLPKATMLVLVVDDDGKIVKQDARELLGVKELDTVYITGKAKRDKAGNVSVSAAKLFVAALEEATKP